MTVTAFAPGRVNLIGEHTDYTGGLAMPMALHLGTTVTGTRTADGTVRLRSSTEAEPAEVDLDVTADGLAGLAPRWARYVGGVVHEVRPAEGFEGTVATTLPVGGGLSSSAALELAVALALGFTGSPAELAAACQRAEQIASGVPCGIMDQLASAAGVAGHALLMNFTTGSVTPVPVPEGATVVVVDSGQERALADSAYAERRAACEAAAAELGPLLEATPADAEALADDRLRRRARHVVGENQRVRDFAEAFRRGDLAAAGSLMVESHRSLRDDFEVSTAVLDELVDQLLATPGVHGARLTGAGFGGCVVALTDAGVTVDVGARSWTVEAGEGARLLER